MEKNIEISKVSSFNGNGNREGMSAQQVADLFGLEKHLAYGFLKVLEKYGMVEVVGKRQGDTGLGKPVILYAFKADLGQAAKLWESLKPVQVQVPTPVPAKRRGRPVGSKNRPKAPTSLVGSIQSSIDRLQKQLNELKAA